MAGKSYVYVPSNPSSTSTADVMAWAKREFEAIRRGLTSEMGASAGRLLSGAIKKYDTPGEYSFVVPTGVYCVRVSLVGGGGSGCLSENAASNNTGSGGNGGDAIVDRVLYVSPGDTITGSVGAGGAAVTSSVISKDGNAGEDTTLSYRDMTFTALGGLGGKQGNVDPGPNGGTQTYDGIYVSGGQGKTGADGDGVLVGGVGGAKHNVVTTYYVGGGGASFFGNGLDAGGSDTLDCEVWDAATHGYGCGGGGYGEATLEVSDASGAGGDGVAIFTWSGAEYGA